MRSIKLLLPSYLQGRNINGVCDVIDSQNRKQEGNQELLGLCFSLERPILIERVQQEFNGQADLTVHVNSPGTIKSCDIVYDNPYTEDVHETYTEEEVITQIDITNTIYDEYSIVRSGCTVTVETYDGQTYTKSYPENDTILSNNADHDKYLDHLGALLNIPRRLFKPTGGQSEEDYKNCYPSYWAKDDLNAPYWTEDDYYYMKRLKYFCENYGQKDTLILMSEVLYATDDVALFNMKDRTTSIYADIRSLVGTNILCMSQGVQYRNIDYTNQNEVLQKYMMITRPVTNLQKQNVDYAILESSIEDNIFSIQGSVDVYDTDMEYVSVLEQAPFDVYVDDTKIGTTLSNNNGEFTYSIDVTDYEAGIHTLHFKYADKYELHDITEGTCAIEFNSSGLERTSITLQTTTLNVYYGDTAHISGVLCDANNNGLAGKRIRIYLPNTAIADEVTDNNGAFDYAFQVANHNWDGRVYSVTFDRDLEYLECTTTCTLNVLRHEVNMTVPDMVAVIGDTLSVPVTLVDESSNPVSIGTVSAELERVDKQSIDIVDATGYDYSLYFVGAVTSEVDGTSMIECTLQIVDTATDEVIGGLSAGFTDNVLSGVSDTGWSMIFPDLTYDTLAYQNGVIVLSGLVSDLSSLIDSVNGIVSIPISVGKQAGTQNELIMVQDITTGEE